MWNLAADGLLVAAAWYLAFQLRFDHGVPIYYRTLFERTVVPVVVINLVVFLAFGFYNRWWRYVSTRDMWVIARGVVVACLVADIAVYFVSPVHNVRLPRSIAVLDFLLTLAFITGARLVARSIIERPQARNVIARGKEVIVVGAGDAARLIVREMLRTPAVGYTPIGLIDDDPRKKDIRIEGIRVLGTIDDLPHVLRDNKPDEILIAIPSAPGELRQRVVDVAGDVPVKTLPGLHELITGDVNLTLQIRPIQVEDVLGRQPVEVDLDSIAVVPRGRDGARHRRGRLDRLGALPPDRAHGPGAARARRPGRDAALRDRARARRRARVLRRRGRCSPTSGTAPRCGRSSSATRPGSSSTPPRTSTCR